MEADTLTYTSTARPPTALSPREGPLVVPNHHESAFFSWRRSMSSPGWNMSVTMSNPPTNSPSTYNCGMVGQSEYFLMPSRMFGCSSTLTLSNSAPVTSRMRMTWELNPHMGEAGVP